MSPLHTALSASALVERLRYSEAFENSYSELNRAAADMIERLHREVEELRAAIAPFAAWAGARVPDTHRLAGYDEDEQPVYGASSASGMVVITLGDLRRARRVLAPLSNAPGA